MSLDFRVEGAVTFTGATGFAAALSGAAFDADGLADTATAFDTITVAAGVTGVDFVTLAAEDLADAFAAGLAFAETAADFGADEDRRVALLSP